MTANHTKCNQKQPEVSNFCKVNVANNVAQAKVRDLTEQWKKGELEQGWYYINDGQIDYKYSKHSFVDFFVTPHEDIKEVLAPVPSYEEWQDTENRSLLTAEFSNEIDELNEENQQLRKWCEEFNALDVAKENQQLKLIIKRTKASGNYPSKVSQYKARITALTEENQQLKDVISKMCMELVDPDDAMSNGLAEYFNQDLLLEIHEVLK